MGLTMHERHAVVRELAPRFHRAGKNERTQIITNFVALTGYNRCYAAYILRNCGKKQSRVVRGRSLVFTPAHARRKGSKRKRLSRYGSSAFTTVLKRLWALSDGLCGKRLVAFIRQIVPHLEQQGALKVSSEDIRQQLLSVSPATIDRLLVKTKRECLLYGRTTTRPGTLLKYQVPIRTFSQWDDKRPGFCEMDLVSHDGGSIYGDCCHTLTLTDIISCWTELGAVQNKAQCHVFDALKDIRQRLPFELLGLDSDNGSEFINGQLIDYCEIEHISFTRSRPYRKNDSCYVEQKNYSIVRRSVGYYRYDTPQQLELLQLLYSHLRLYTNFFQPVMKLKEKIRTGSHLTRRYDEPQSPYARLLAHPDIDPQRKEALRQQYHKLNVITLKAEISRIQAELFRLAREAGPPPQPPRNPPYPGADHPWRHNLHVGRHALERKNQIIDGDGHNTT
jgi:hypothetical protein